MKRNKTRATKTQENRSFVCNRPQVASANAKVDEEKRSRRRHRQRDIVPDKNGGEEINKKLARLVYEKVRYGGGCGGWIDGYGQVQPEFVIRAVVGMACMAWRRCSSRSRKGASRGPVCCSPSCHPG